MCVSVYVSILVSLTAALRPGKLKKVSGPCLWGIWFNTDNSLIACLGWKREERKGQGRRGQVRREWLSFSMWRTPPIRGTGERICYKKNKKKKHGVTSHLYHNPTGSITLQSPPPSPDNTSSIPWQPLIDLSLERAAGGGDIGKDREIEARWMGSDLLLDRGGTGRRNRRDGWWFCCGQLISDQGLLMVVVLEPE